MDIWHVCSNYRLHKTFARFRMSKILSAIIRKLLTFSDNLE